MTAERTFTDYLNEQAARATRRPTSLAEFLAKRDDLVEQRQDQLVRLDELLADQSVDVALRTDSLDGSAQVVVALGQGRSLAFELADGGTLHVQSSPCSRCGAPSVGESAGRGGESAAAASTEGGAA